MGGLRDGPTNQQVGNLGMHCASGSALLPGSDHGQRTRVHHVARQLHLRQPASRRQRRTGEPVKALPRGPATAAVLTAQQNIDVSTILFSPELAGAGPQLEERESDSPLIAKVRRVRFGSDCPALVVPDGNWDLLFVRSSEGLRVALQSGQLAAPLIEGGWRGTEVLAVSFRTEVYMPRWAARRAAHNGPSPIDAGASRLRLDSEGTGTEASLKLEQLVFAMNGTARPIEGDRKFWVGPERLEIPSFESAEQLAAAMARCGLLEKDRVVARALRGVRQRLDERTVQRHFAAVAGITLKRISQIDRVHQAARLLRLRQPAAQVAAELGFTDQAHLSHSVKRILGLTPRQVAAW